MAKVKANGIEIEYETAGNKTDPALLLVMGLGAQLTIWPDTAVRGAGEAGLLRHPLRQPRHRPVDRLRLVGRAQPLGAVQKVDEGREGRRAVPPEGHGGRRDRPARCARHRARAHGRRLDGRHDRPDRRRAISRAHALDGLDLFDQRPARPAAGQARGAGHAVGAARGAGARAARRARHEAAPRDRRPGLSRADAELRAFVEKNVDRRWYPEGAARQYLVGASPRATGSSC